MLNIIVTRFELESYYFEKGASPTRLIVDTLSKAKLKTKG